MRDVYKDDDKKKRSQKLHLTIPVNDIFEVAALKDLPKYVCVK